MGSTLNKSSEALKERAVVSKPDRKENLKDSREVKETAEAGKAAFFETVGMDEGVETTGKVSEVLSEVKDQQGDGVGTGGGGSASTKFDPVVIKARLLKNVPREKDMLKQIEKEIKKEINYLHKKAMRMLRTPGEANYYEMNNIMRKIRDLRGILIKLAKSAVDSLKSLWLRYVHGVMH